MNYLVLIAVIYFLFSQKSDLLSEISSLITPEQLAPVISLLGIDENTLGQAAEILPELINGNLQPADLIKKTMPLIISSLTKNAQKSPPPSDGDGLEPVNGFIPDDFKEKINLFFD